MATETMIIANQVEDSRSPYGEVELPCGFILDDNLYTKALVREITGHEEDMLGSDKIKPMVKMTELIARCMVRLGPIQEPAKLAAAARALTIGDRAVLVLGIRRFTLGDLFPYQDQCPHSNCREKNLYQVPLSTLDLKRMPDPMKRVYDARLPHAEVPVRFHVMVGEDEERISRYQTDQLSQALLARVDLIGDRAPSLTDIKNLHLRDRNYLRAQFMEVEGGIDTDIQMTCPSCGTQFERELDISQQGFFFPSQVLSRSKKKSSS